MPEQTLEACNKEFPVGTLVKYWSILGEGPGVKTKTRSEVWLLGHGAPVVKINGVLGGVSIFHLKKRGK